MLVALQLPSPSYQLTAPQLLLPPRTCAAPPQLGAATPIRPPMCARRTGTLFALEPERAAEVDAAPANGSARVLELAALLAYPIKSVRALPVPSARLAPEGLEGDRRLLVASAANLATTQRQQPRLATVSASIEGRRLSLRAPGQPPLNVTLPLEASVPNPNPNPNPDPDPDRNPDPTHQCRFSHSLVRTHHVGVTEVQTG